MTLGDTRIGYDLEKEGPQINHLVYMDDLKLYAKNEDQIDALVQTVHICSVDIGMEFGITKCAVMTMKRGKLVESRGIELPSGERVGDPESTGYKYIGILELDEVMNESMKTRITDEYMKRLRLLLKTKLNAGNLIKAINCLAVAVVRYSAAIVDLNRSEIEELDRRTRKTMTVYRALHPKANVIRLYMPRKIGGRGLVSIEDCVASERRTLDWYLANNNETLLKYVALQQGLDNDTIEIKTEYRKRIENEKVNLVENMPLHGQFQRDTKDLKTEDSWKWLAKGDLKRETESLLIAAQDQALNTNSIKKAIYKQDISDKCRLCGERVENVTHIVSSCKMLAQKDYKRRHDKVCLNLHWSLCQKYGFQVNTRWYLHEPDKVLENEHAKIIWDFTIQTDRKIEHNRPDITLVDKEADRCFLIDVAVPGDSNITQKEFEKTNNYADLRVEIERMWNRKKTVIPVVIGALGSIPHKLLYFLDQLKIKYNVGVLQKSALLGTANILWKVLSI